MDAAIAQTPPPVSVTLALDPTILKEDEAIELSATIVSQASFPITILAYSTIFDVREAQRRSRPGADYQCVDVDTNTPVRLQDRICGRFDNISHKLDDSDSQYFHRLQPGVSYKFSGHCILLCRELVPGHKYRLSVDEEANMGWWRYGKKEEVLESAEQKLPQYMFWPSGDPIDLTITQPVEFTVPTNWTNIGASVSADTSGMVPPRYLETIGDHAMELSITAVSHALTPITICTWSTIFCTNGIQRSVRGSGTYVLTHLKTGTLIPTEEIFHSRDHQITHRKDRYFHTLHAEQPYRFSGLLTPSFAAQLRARPGRYHLAVSDSIKSRWWKEGTREEITTPFGQKPTDDMYVANGEPIVVTNIEPIELTIAVDD
ncbi:hypothetical protein MBLNU13_g11625t2 [Cladosporium sp. NU13]